MSITYSLTVNNKRPARAHLLRELLLNWLQSERLAPVVENLRPFSVINAELPSFNRTLGITNDANTGTVFVSDGYMTAYGCNNQHTNIVMALRHLGVSVRHHS